MTDLQATGLALQFVVADKASDRAIGTCLLFRLEEGSRRAELGYVLGRAHWGRGLMQEALSALLDRAFGRWRCAGSRPRWICATRRRRGCCSGWASRAKGLLRQRWVSKGEAKDVEIYGLLRDEWPARA